MSRVLLLSIVVISSYCVSAHVAWAEQKKASRSPSSESSNQLEFDEKVIESLGMRDLTSASHTGENKRRQGDRLIRERTDFRDELKRTLKEVKWVR